MRNEMRRQSCFDKTLPVEIMGAVEGQEEERRRRVREEDTKAREPRKDPEKEKRKVRKKKKALNARKLEGWIQEQWSRKEGKEKERGRKTGGGRRKRQACLWERQQAAVHHVSLHWDVFFYTLNDDTHQSRPDSCIKPAANMQRPAVWNLLTPPIAAYRRNQSATRPPSRIYLCSRHTSLLSSPANLE